MKKFILKWGKGSVCEIQTIYKTLEIEAESINDIKPLEILPEYIKKKVFYVRTIHTSETRRNYDYGSWVDFIELEEMK